MLLPDALARSASSGNGNSTTKCSRRMNASSMFSRRLVARIGDAVVLLHALQQVGRPRCWRSGRGRRAPRSACRRARRPRRRTGSRRRARRRAKIRSRFFSVSPMYLLTTAERSIAVEVEAELAGDDLGGHRLAGARRAGEEGGEPPGAACLRRSPSSRGPARDGARDCRSRAAAPSVGGQDDVAPDVARDHLRGEAVERWSGHGAGGRAKSSASTWSAPRSTARLAAPADTAQCFRFDQPVARRQIARVAGLHTAR